MPSAAQCSAVQGFLFCVLAVLVSVLGFGFGCGVGDGGYGQHGSGDSRGE